MNKKEIKSAVLEMNEASLDLEKVRALRTQAPTPEDIGTLKEYKDAGSDISKLGKVEQFFLETMSIPRYSQRLECWIFKMSFEKDVMESEATLDVINNAGQQLKDSGRLHRLLKLSLGIGNFLNGGTPRGGAYGFKIDVLKKFSELKDVSNKKHLMHYLAEFCAKHDADLLTVSEDFPDIEEATKIPLSQWNSDFQVIVKGCKLVGDQLELAKKDKLDPKDRFIATMEPFLEKASKTQQRIQNRFEQTEKMSEETLQRFAEDVKKVGIDDFFKEVAEFLRRFDKAFQENQARDEKEQKAREKKARAELKKHQMSEKRKAADKSAENLVDSVFGKMKQQDAKEVLEDMKQRDRRATQGRHQPLNVDDGGNTNAADAMRLMSPSDHVRTKTRAVKELAVDDEAALEEEKRRIQKFAKDVNADNSKSPKKGMLGESCSENCLSCCFAAGCWFQLSLCFLACQR
ncbi:unnamed protein product [Phaeothamnion confervicola]